MATKQGKKRRRVRSLGWLAAGGSFLLVLLPVWFPWVLAPVAGHYGLAFAGYDRMGWTRFALTGVHGAWGGTRLAAQRVELVLPAQWLWRRLSGGAASSPLLTLSDGHLLIGPSAANAGTIPSAEPPGSMDETLNQVSRIGQALQRLLPAAVLTNCTLQVASNRVAIPHAFWRAGRLQAVVRLPSLRGEIELVGRIGGDSALELSAAWEAHEASLRGGFYRAAAGWRWAGELGWLANRADLRAQFAAHGWWPVQAQADGRRWQVPAEFFQVQGYENPIASLTANLVSNRFNLQATGLARPSDASARRGFPAVEFSLGAAGDPTGVKLHTLNLQLPWLQADLTNTVGLTWTSELLAEPAQLRVAVDLEKLPGTTLTGRVAGVVRIEPQAGRTPVAKFRFSAGPVNARQWHAKTVLVHGEFAAPMLKFDEMRADFADGSVLAAAGSFDGETRRIVGGRWQLTGGLVQQILPGLSCAESAASGELSGPLTNLAHRGAAALITCRIAGLKPLDLRARWSGQHRHLTSAEVSLTAGESVLSIGGSADLKGPEREVSATLNQLGLRRGNEELYTLQLPCAITFRGGETNGPGPRWTLAVEAFNWRSERRIMAGTADLAWPSRGKVALTMTNVAGADFADFLEAEVANISMAELAVAAYWSNGPVHSVVSAAGLRTSVTGQEFVLRGAVKTDEVLRIEQLAVGVGSTPTLLVTGTVPVQVIPGREEGLLVWDRAQNLRLAGDWRDDRLEACSIPLGSRGKLEVSQPELHFRVSGPPHEPSAKLTAGATELVWQSQTPPSPRPKLEDLQLAVEIRPDAIRLTTFAAKLDGQPMTATGEWPLSGEAWRSLWASGKLPDWNQAQGRLELEGAQVAAFSAYLPVVLLPEGRLNANLQLQTGKRLEGMLSLTNAATRPLGTIPPLRDIAALVRIDGHRAVLEDFRGQIGGQPVRADGFVTVAALDGRGLDYRVNLRGTNVPLARSPDLLLRGDFEVSLRGGSNLPPVISGVVALHDGLHVQYASALVWSGPSRPEWRPPYFSVTNQPFADWKLDLAIRGNRFLRTRTPMFSGIVSADFHVTGSLLAPVLTGDARVNSGRLIFPFGSLTIHQGIASFRGDNPKGPELLVNASGRNYRYDLRLEVKGPADGANVVFTSTPPLASEQILLLLTAGELPPSDFAFSGGARAGRLATFLGKDMLSRYRGSDPAEERVIIRTGQSISQAGRLTYSVEYRLTDRWSIIGEYDEFNAFNTDLKWKVFAR